MNLKMILDKHRKWLKNELGGARANLSGANLSGADLSYADLSGANLRGARNLNTISWNIFTAFYMLQCPETGAFIGYKSVKTWSRAEKVANQPIARAETYFRIV